MKGLSNLVNFLKRATGWCDVVEVLDESTPDRNRYSR